MGEQPREWIGEPRDANGTGILFAFHLLAGIA
jgi:hypothetical protein